VSNKGQTGRPIDKHLSSLPPYLLSRLRHWCCPRPKAFDGWEEEGGLPPLGGTEGGREGGKDGEKLITD